MCNIGDSEQTEPTDSPVVGTSSDQSSTPLAIVTLPSTMPTYGRLEAYNESDDWTSYKERVDQYFVANKITESATQKAIFLATVGVTAYGTLRNILAPVKPCDAVWPDITEALNKHYSPEPSSLVQRCKFYSRFRRDSETISIYVAELRKLSEHCKFGTVLEESLRDRLVAGVKDAAIQRKLLEEEATLTFKRAFELALQIETTRKDTDLLQAHTPKGTAAVNKVNLSKPNHPKKKYDNSKWKPNKNWEPSNNSSPKPGTFSSSSDSTTCHRCGSSNHRGKDCKFINEKCHFCSKVGHIEKVCMSKHPKATHNVSVVHADTSTDTVYELFNMVSGGEPLTTHIDVDGSPLRMEIDTGAAVTIISESTFHEHWACRDGPPVIESKELLRTYTGEVVKVTGKINVPVSHSSKVTSLDMLVVPGDGPSLLGRDWLAELDIKWSSVNNVSAPSSVPLEQLLQKYPSVFNDDYTEVTHATAHIRVPDNAVPSYFKARPLPYLLAEKVNPLTRCWYESTVANVTASPSVPLEQLLEKNYTPPTKNGVAPRLPTDGNCALPTKDGNAPRLPTIVNRTLPTKNGNAPRLPDDRELCSIN